MDLTDLDNFVSDIITKYRLLYDIQVAETNSILIRDKTETANGTLIAKHIFS